MSLSRILAESSMSELANGDSTENNLKMELRQLMEERAYLYYLIYRREVDAIRDGKEAIDEEFAQFCIQVKQLSRQYSLLLGELATAMEENEEVFTTLQEITDERESLAIDMQRTSNELESCKSVLDFLVLEQDELKKESSTKQALLATYQSIFNPQALYFSNIPQPPRKRMIKK